jgi:receptor protein-tyrosine kinase
MVVGPALAVAAAVFVTGRMTPMYHATAQLVVVNQTTNQQSVIAQANQQLAEINARNVALGLPQIPAGNVIDLAALASLNALEVDARVTNTYVNLIERRPILEAVIANLALPLTVEDLEKKIDVTVIAETQLLNVQVSDADPALAAAIANATAQTFVADVEVQLGKAGAVIIAEQAVPAKTPFSPKLPVNVAIAIFFSVMLAAGVAAALEYLDDTIKTADDLEPLGLTSLGTVSRFRGHILGKKAPLEASDFNSRSAEAYRQLRTNIRFTSVGSGMKTIVLTSSHPGEGKSTTASNLAAVLAQAGDRVILVDADLRRSSLRKTFDSPTSFGLTGLLYNDIQDPSVALVNTRWKNLRLLPAGVLPPNPSELLTSARMLRVIEALRDMADYVIFDTPPVLAVTDAIVLAARTDGTILVTEAHRTRTESLRQASRLLEQANARGAGVVINRARTVPASYYYYRDETPENVEVEADPRKATAGAASIVAAPAPAVTAAEAPAPKPASQPKPATSSDLLQRHLGGSLTPLPQQNGNGHPDDGTGKSDDNGNGNGNGHAKELVSASAGVPVTAMETAALSESVADMLSRMDETMNLFRSLKPGSNQEEPGGV